MDLKQKETPDDSFKKFLQIEALHLKKTLVLIAIDLLLVCAILASLSAASFLIDKTGEIAKLAQPFKGWFHQFHVASSLTLYVLLGLRTIDHFLGGAIVRLAKNALSQLRRDSA